MNILSRDVRNGCPVAVRIAVEDQAGLVPVFPRPIKLGSQKQAQLQWHVESRKSRLPAQAYRGNIVNAKWALRNDPLYLFEPHLARIINLKCAPCSEAQFINGKNDGIEERFVGVVERAVDKYIFTASSA